MRIDDGGGKGGNQAAVGSDLRLWTDSKTISAQHTASSDDELAFQVSTSQAITNSDVPVLHMTNNSSTHDLVVTFIRMMSIGAAASNVGAYFTISLGDSYTSGGAALTPVNMNSESSIDSDTTIYDGSSSLTVSGGSEIDRNYTANEMLTYSKHGALILKKGTSMTINHLGSTVAGTAYCRISYYFEKKD
jgi:hypothetical protein